jgi:hypothetical protein
MRMKLKKITDSQTLERKMHKPDNVKYIKKKRQGKLETRQNEVVV